MFYSLRLHRRRQVFANILPAYIAVQIFGVATVFVAILKIFLLFGSSTSGEAEKQERESEGVALWYLGQHLAGHHPDEEVLIIVAPSNMRDQSQKIRLDGLMRGISGSLKTRIVPVKFNKRKKKRFVRTYTYQNLNEVLLNNQDCKVVVSLIGLPKDYYLMPYWDEIERLPAIYSYRGYSIKIDEDIEDKFIAGYIAQKPGKQYRAEKDGDVEETREFFNKYFFFMNSKNFNEIKRKYSYLFNYPKKRK